LSHFQFSFERILKNITAGLETAPGSVVSPPPQYLQGAS